MSAQENQALIRQYVDQFLNRGNMAAADVKGGIKCHQNLGRECPLFAD